ncbi:electron transfer flavoprotein subunit alpha/FixB family protein [Desulfatitalea alkaliphila]|uniref:Electron transfer flavoprotein subunit alpha/FixB family protein n=1 Tax=Desulfatitalea alkaliphila TaxID=2929485 RepID=A0AA41R7A3_9BACT|nr:electron transfer flavoprotein subunit alpha/FixB family protein [Desulfatitalea alkaliphila]MCJ8502822.1 electron transfer flavoprotein subunit alpha/FixB family protein [Desulfatitalea alkaliphila]
MAQMFAYIAHKCGEIDDTAAELAVAAKKIDASAEVTAIVVGDGAELDTVCQAAAKLYPQVWKFAHADLAYPNAEMVRKLLVNVLAADAIVLFPHDTFAMDLAPGLAVKLDSAYVPDIVGVDGMDGGAIKLVRQEYAGMAHAHIACDAANGALLTMRPGSFQPEAGADAGGTVTDKSGDIGDVSAKRRFLEIKVAEVGDVDITKADVLVSVGRGIEEQDNLEVAEELAKAMGAVVSCSRPIVDAKWLEKSRQVGTSGVTVKPKVYLAMGISGSFQHMGGIKGSPFIVAVNKNPKAPIFQMADVGIVEDILEFMPALTEKLEG